MAKRTITRWWIVGAVIMVAGGILRLYRRADGGLSSKLSHRPTGGSVRYGMFPVWVLASGWSWLCWQERGDS